MCGDNKIDNGEQCEKPNTFNNPFCRQGEGDCFGYMTGQRDPYGDCNAYCQCVYDPLKYKCIKGSCGAECGRDLDCKNKCVGDVRYFEGDCGEDCLCDFNTENCPEKNGWYNTTTKRWTNCLAEFCDRCSLADACKECRQIKQEYREYYCTPSQCRFDRISYRWIDTGEVKVNPCREGYRCVDGRCVPKDCEGSVQIHAQIPNLERCPNRRFEVSADGLIWCDGKNVEFRLGSCDGELLDKCRLSKGQCDVKLKSKIILLNPEIYACIDKNGDKDFIDQGEQIFIKISFDCGDCESTELASCFG